MATQAELDELQSLVTKGLANKDANPEETRVVFEKARSIGATPEQLSGMADVAGTPISVDDIKNTISKLESNTNSTASTTTVQNRSDISGPITNVNTSSLDDDTRLGLAKVGQADIAGGNVNIAGANQQAVQISQDGTNTPYYDVQSINSTGVQAPHNVQATQVNNAAVNNAAQASQPDPLQAVTIDGVSEVAEIAATQAAQADISTGATATMLDDQANTGTQAESVEIDTSTPGAEVEAVTGDMPPEAIAAAATVAGLEAARVDQAKQQLRTAGLTESQIAVFGNDPSALEMELTNFTEEQRGIIAGLPEEALVSTQMEQLLTGLESGDMPSWAKPAVTAVEQMLKRRGLSASTIGRDALANAIIQSSIPIAQANAQTVKESAMQQRDILAQKSVAEAQLKQQATLQNAQNAFNLNIRNLDAQQQAELANSQFMQTVAVTNATNKQQAAIQNAVNMTTVQAEAIEGNSQIAINNARNFLQMDLSNLSNEQQGIIIDQQYTQQRMLSNAAAENAMKQFNAGSQNQVNQFMTNLAATIDQFNVTQANSMRQFNATEANRVQAINSGNMLQAEQFNSQLMTQVDQFNSQQELTVEQWNAANAQAIEQSNVQWRRQANTADTAAQNAINQQNTQNAFSLTSQAQAALWQELRDAAAFAFQGNENQQDREAQLYAAAIGNESAASNNYDHTAHLVTLAQSFFT